MSRALLAAALALAVVPALSACGENKEEAFRKDFPGVNARILALGNDVGKTVNGASSKKDKQIEDEFGKLAQRTGALSQDVDQLEPPDKLHGTTDDLVQSLGDAKDALSDIEKAAGKHDPQGARKATIQLVASSRDLRAARLKLERATR